VLSSKFFDEISARPSETMDSNTALTSMITRIFIITMSAKKIFLTVTIVVYIAIVIAITVRILGRLVVVFFVLEILKCVVYTLSLFCLKTI
jgi:hypothetical protein